ncbi:MAG: CRISPR-associated endonuclease Cas2 [Candidatus Gracilibacteria bacterium]|nr:CRISPR-associated endonuclease Cas2 [Candidatus Gracilibacteria bacterium]
MLIITYDISNDKVRTKFGKFLKKYGRRLQYSVFELKNSERILNIIKMEVEKVFKPQFTGADSILILPFTKVDREKVIRYGQPAMEEEEILFL